MPKKNTKKKEKFVKIPKLNEKKNNLMKLIEKEWKKNNKNI
mgnify:FL=1|tara:strand:+ start:62 stop:184 length:123 start_codon:yes stop_codon:yes gene_type:complete